MFLPIDSGHPNSRSMADGSNVPACWGDQGPAEDAHKKAGQVGNSEDNRAPYFTSVCRVQSLSRFLEDSVSSAD